MTSGHAVLKNGWVTDQHGSWAMGFAPLICGLILVAHIQWANIVVALAWTAGFFFFGVAEKWLKFRFKTRYRPALITYAVTSLLLCILAVIAAPHLVWWLPVYAPLVALSFYQSWRRRERELVSRWVAICAAGLVTAVVVNASTNQAWFAGGVSHRAWIFSLLIIMYFASTVPFIKTLIRERGNPRWLWFSIVLHIICALIVLALTLHSQVGWFHMVMWCVLVARAKRCH